MLVAVEDGSPKMLAFLMPHHRKKCEGKFEDFLTSVDEIEKATGLDFFHKLPDDVENTLEAETAEELW